MDEFNLRRMSLVIKSLVSRKQPHKTGEIFKLKLHCEGQNLVSNHASEPEDGADGEIADKQQY